MSDVEMMSFTKWYTESELIYKSAAVWLQAYSIKSLVYSQMAMIVVMFTSVLGVQTRDDC